MKNNECEGCEKGLDAMHAKQDELMKKYGWLFHFVFPDENYPFNVNIHTHGFMEKFKHPDMQICAPISKETAQGIMNNIARKLEAGKTFKANKKYKDIIEGFPVMICTAMENGREVLRVVLPGKEGSFNSEFAKYQMEDKTNSN